MKYKQHVAIIDNQHIISINLFSIYNEQQNNVIITNINNIININDGTNLNLSIIFFIMFILWKPLRLRRGGNKIPNPFFTNI